MSDRQPPYSEEAERGTSGIKALFFKWCPRCQRERIVFYGVICRGCRRFMDRFDPCV